MCTCCIAEGRIIVLMKVYYLLEVSRFRFEEFVKFDEVASIVIGD